MEQQNMGSKRSAPSASGKIAAKSHETAEQLKDAVVGQVAEARERAQSAKDHTSERIRRAANQLRSVSETLRDDDPLLADFAERASHGVDGVARYVGSATPQSIVQDTERLARRQPALFYGGAFLLGLAAGRFLKSSRPASDDNHRDFARREYEGASRPAGERESGFFAAGADRPARSNPRFQENTDQRFQENYDATFGRDPGAPPRPARSESEPAAPYVGPPRPGPSESAGVPRTSTGKGSIS